jgi:TolA-binding protein
MDPAIAGLIAAVTGGVLLYVVNPLIQRKLEASKSNDPALGWQTAVQQVKEQALELAARVSTLEREVERLENENEINVATINRQDRIIQEQGEMIKARDGRVAQLESLWRTATGNPPPSPDPAIGYWLYRPLTGGPV